MILDEIIEKTKQDLEIRKNGGASINDSAICLVKN